MKKYIEITIHCLPEKVDIISASLAQVNYEGFWEDGSKLKAYIERKYFSKKELYDLLAQHQMENAFQVSSLEDKNWNEEWEKNYAPVLVDDRLCIRAPFHSESNEQKLNLIIEPNMTFGTGHHETTLLMIKMMLTLNITDTNVLDMGSGTGVLSLLASKLGANSVLGIDNQEGSEKNAAQNAKYNGISNVYFKLGSVDDIPESKEYDVILSNITKNINMQLIPHLVKHLKKTGHLIVAGFLNFDIEEMHSLLTTLGLTPIRSMSKGDWECLLYQKNSYA